MNNEKRKQLDELESYINQYSGISSNLKVYIHENPLGSDLRCAAEEIVIDDPLFLSELYKRCGYFEITAIKGNEVALVCEVLRPSFEEKNIVIDKESVPAGDVFEQVLDEIEKRKDLSWEVDNNKYEDYKSWLLAVDELIEDSDAYQIEFEVDEESRMIDLSLDMDEYEVDTIKSPLMKVMEDAERLIIRESVQGIRFIVKRNGIWL